MPYFRIGFIIYRYTMLKSLIFIFKRIKIYDALNLTEPNPGKTIQQAQPSQIKAIYNKGGNEKKE